MITILAFSLSFRLPAPSKRLVIKMQRRFYALVVLGSGNRVTRVGCHLAQCRRVNTNGPIHTLELKEIWFADSLAS
jgi:hypothetical protein